MLAAFLHMGGSGGGGEEDDVEDGGRVGAASPEAGRLVPLAACYRPAWWSSSSCGRCTPERAKTPRRLGKTVRVCSGLGQRRPWYSCVSGARSRPQSRPVSSSVSRPRLVSGYLKQKLSSLLPTTVIGYTSRIL